MFLYSVTHMQPHMVSGWVSVLVSWKKSPSAVSQCGGGWEVVWAEKRRNHGRDWGREEYRSRLGRGCYQRYGIANILYAFLPSICIYTTLWLSSILFSWLCSFSHFKFKPHFPMCFPLHPILSKLPKHFSVFLYQFFFFFGISLDFCTDSDKLFIYLICILPFFPIM